jgi:hypothetical protein
VSEGLPGEGCCLLGYRTWRTVARYAGCADQHYRVLAVVRPGGRRAGARMRAVCALVEKNEAERPVVPWRVLFEWAGCCAAKKYNLSPHFDFDKQRRAQWPGPANTAGWGAEHGGDGVGRADREHSLG